MSYPTTPLPRGPILIPGCCTDMPQTYFSLSLFTHIISSCAPLSPALSPFFFSHYHCYFIPPILCSLAPPPCLVLFSIFPSFFIPPQPSASVKLRISTLKTLNKCCLVSDAPVLVHVWPPSPRLLSCSRPCFAVLICFMYTSFCWYCICVFHAMCLMCTCLIVFVSFCLDNASSQANGNNYDHYIEGIPVELDLVLDSFQGEVIYKE